MTAATRSAQGGVKPPATIGSTHQPLRERVRDLIRDRILRGDFVPGDHLVERVLAEEMGVSRVPVREALNLLKGEGFVQDLPRRGVIVTVLGKDDVDDLFEVRVALDVQCARLASMRATDDELEELAAIADEADAAYARGDTAALAELNQAFHDAVPRMAHNPILASTLEPLEGRLHWLLRQNRSPEVLLAEHRELVHALRDRDADAAAEVARRHVDTSRTLCHEIMAGDDA
ncbi:MAG TPA: GntR family transcriptional regulator [Microbacterium sp.]|jgi:DNA-binding GntR family transcriptional regulator|uniref:GntR family transcriptional regulator n=1 Tax=Microbacterium sp. TaxID=51671 RepID=UPI002F94CDAD